MTKAHNDRIQNDSLDYGYSIRVGKKLPVNSANLAYVSTPKLSPKDNVVITDLSGQIKENGLPSTYRDEKVVFPDDTFLLRELSGESKVPSKNVILSDEFSIPETKQDRPTPLYYRARTKGYFDAKGASVAPYKGGYMHEPIEKIYDYAEIEVGDRDQLIYTGSKIRITYLDGSALKKEHKYKIQLVRQEGEGVPLNAYVAYIYTNFRSSKNETFVIRYEKYESDGTHIGDYVEVLNSYPFFEQVKKSELDALAATPKVNNEWKEELTHKKYAVTESSSDTYEVYAPSQVAVANNQTRPAHQFKYKIESKLKAKFSQANPGKIKVGIAYLNQTVFSLDIESLSGVMKRVYEDQLRPQYLDMENPHNAQLSFIKENTKYWSIDLNMPSDHYDDYDLLILTGYGFYDMSGHNDSLRRYLQNGGTIWIDNAGSGDQVLTFRSNSGRETFLTNIGFSSTENETGFKVKGTGEKTQDYLNRMYLLGDTGLDIGYKKDTYSVNPKITFGSGESATRWSTIVNYSSTKPSIIYRAIEKKGTIIVSNCGVFRSASHDNGNETNMKLVMNMMLTIAESKWMTSPWIHDYVHHRDNLFRQEYDGFGPGDAYYFDDKSDIDSTQIVAKKVISRTTRDAMLPYLPETFYTAKGDYSIRVESNNVISIINNNFEVGAYDPVTGNPITSWTSTTVAAIQGWGVKRVAGSTPQFNHVSSYSHRGQKAVEVVAPTDGVGSHAYWLATTSSLVAGSYRVTTWIKTDKAFGLSGSGPTIGVYKIDGTKIGTATPVLDTRDWTKVELSFSLTQAQAVELRLGFVDGNGTGSAIFDYVELESVGSVYNTPDNDGSLPLYFYAVKPKGTSFNIKEQGFDNSDITVYDPYVDLEFVVRSFVFTWNNRTGRMERRQGNSVTYRRKIRRSDGIINMGSLSTLIPGLPEGKEWADANKVYYEIFLDNQANAEENSRLVNISIYDTDSGEYFFTKDGENVVAHKDMFLGAENKGIIIQARTDYYTIRATKRRYGMKVEAEDKIYLEYPSTIDTRDCWFLRVKNGAFVKNEMGYKELLDLKMYDSRYYELQERLFGTHYYSLPEYGRQVFKPSVGIKRIREEIAEYVNDNTIRVQDAPLYILEGESRGEKLSVIDDNNTVFEGLNKDWLAYRPVSVYVDENLDGAYVEWKDGFDIDYKKGYIIFKLPVTGDVKADYGYSNLHVYKRTYNNIRVRNETVTSNGERMQTADKKTFVSSHRNWMIYPTPVVRFVKGKNSENIVPSSAYTIDYESGVVTFKEDINETVLVDYSYSTDQELKVRDYDVQNGIIYLEDEIDFKDEIYVNYFYEEKYMEYRGYWDEYAQRFIHLDLNPMDGHYATLPSTQEVSGKQYVVFRESPTAKLMNKEIYVYIVPFRDSFGNHNQHTIRHCYSIDEWRKIQKTNPAALLLGTVHIRENARVEDSIVLDARTRGGGLKKEITDAQIKKTDSTSMSNWDIGSWEGTAYYKNGVLVIEVPRKVLKNEGGQFTEKEVTDIVRKYVAYGIYYIVEFV